MHNIQISELKNISSNFYKELVFAQNRKPSCFPFIKHEIPSSSLVSEQEVFQVLTVGGSNLLNAMMQKIGKNFHMIKRDSREQIKFVTKDDFFSFIENEIDPNITHLGLNFAYPLDPLFEKGRLDGILTMGSKENTFDGLVGKKIGAELENYIFQKRKQRIVVSVANDTICLLLSGLTEVSDQDIAAGILGTGLNFAVFLDKNHPVNLEAAYFDKFEQSETGRIIDAESTSPGAALFEKEVSGAYLYKHFNIIIEQQKINHKKLNSTKELDAILNDRTSPGYPVAKMLFERSAGLIASAIAGITLFKKKDMTFVMEGSLFWGARQYRRIVKKHLISILPEYSVRFVKIEDSPIFGAAKLVS